MPDPHFDSVPMIRLAAGAAPVDAMDDVAREEPLEIRVRGQAVSVTMRTPGHDEELAAGFLLTERLLRERRDVVSIAPSPRHADGNVVNVTLAPDVPVDMQRLTRHVFASSSCGLCGKATIDAVRCEIDAVTSVVTVPAALIAELPGRLRAVQSTFERTGGLHAAAIFNAAGELRVAREDVGRHNAVDKVIGRCFLNGETPLSRSILLVSGRTSFEIVQKALAAGIPIVAAVSAPSSLAVELARDGGITLIGFLRDSRMNIYTHAQRITA